MGRVAIAFGVGIRLVLGGAFTIRVSFLGDRFILYRHAHLVKTSCERAARTFGDLRVLSGDVFFYRFLHARYLGGYGS